MEGATHFIEVFKDIETERLINSKVIPISLLDNYLVVSNSFSFIATIAIWKIKMKSL